MTKEITDEVKRAWKNYLFSIDLCRIYESQNSMAENLQNISRVRYEAGVIALVEMMAANTMAASMQNKLFDALQQKELAETRLQFV